MLRTEPATPIQRTSEGVLCQRLMFTAPGRVELIAERLSEPGTGEVCARTLVSGISHGTEMAWLRGEAAALHRTWDSERRIYLDGQGRDFPVAPGYETVAKVVDVGSDVTGIAVGDLVYLDRPHADGHIIDAPTAHSGLIPAGAPAERAVFWPLARVALGGVHDAGVQLGETVVVIGLGTVGLLAVQLAKLAGATKVIGVDHYPLRLQAADTFGADVVDAAVDDIADRVRRMAGPAGADAVIEASGSYRGLHQAIRCCRVGGRVATVASYHGEQPGLRLGEEYHRNRISLISSMTVNGCPHRRYPAWDLHRLDHTARGLVSTGRLRVDGLITHRVPFSNARDAYTLINEFPADTIKVVLTYAA